MGFIFYLYLITFIIVLVNELYTLIYNKHDNFIWNYIHEVKINENIIPAEKQKLIYNVVKDSYGTIGVIFPGIYFIWLILGFFTHVLIFHMVVLGMNVFFQKLNNYAITKTGKFHPMLHLLNKIVFSCVYIIIGIHFLKLI